MLYIERKSVTKLNVGFSKHKIQKKYEKKN